MMHGWMDVARRSSSSSMRSREASALHRRARLARLRPDAHAAEPTATGSPTTSATSTALLDHVAPATRRSTCVGHSMGGNVAMIYAGVRPARIRRLVNLEGFGLPETEPGAGAQALREWLDELKAPQALRALRERSTRWRRACARPIRCCAHDARRLAGAALVAHGASRRPRGTSWAIRRTSASTRCSTARTRCSRLLAPHHRADAVGRGHRDRHPQVVGRPLHRARVPERGWRWCRQVERTCSRRRGHMLHHDQPEALAPRADRGVPATAP